MKRCYSASVALCLLAISVTLDAKTYFVASQSANAADANSGTKQNPFKTISAAAKKAVAGDTVRVSKGIYRERVAPANSGTPGKPIVFIAQENESVVIRGSEVVSKGISRLDQNIYKIVFDKTLFNRTVPGGKKSIYNPFATRRSVGDSLLTLGQLFIDGIPYTEVAQQADVYLREKTFCAADSGKSVVFHSEQSKSVQKSLIEVSVRNRIFAPYIRGTSYIVVDGFIMEHCANQYPENFYIRTGPPQEGALGFRGGSHWIVKNCTIRYAKTVGIDCGIEGVEDGDGLSQRQSYRGGNHIITNNAIVDNGAAGIVGHQPRGTIIAYNYIERNNREGFLGMEGGGIKLHSLTDGLIIGNVVRDNGICGIWLDNGAARSRVTRNAIIANMGAGFFMELGRDSVLIDNNIIALTMVGGNLAGDGIYSHDACNVHIINNLIYGNANYGIWNHIGTDRVANALDQASHWRVYNNMIFANIGGAISFPPSTIHSSDNLSDYNLFTGSYDNITLETWGAPLDKPQFMINTNKGRFSIDTLAILLQKAEKTAKTDSLTRSYSSAWRNKLALSFQSWKALSGQDSNSKYPVVLRPSFSRFDCTFEFTISDVAATMQCPVYAPISHDYAGREYAQKKCIPGPFQNLVFEKALSDSTTYATPNRGLWEKLVIAEKNKNRLSLLPITEAIPEKYLKAWQTSVQLDKIRYEPKVYAPNALGTLKNPVAIYATTDSLSVSKTKSIISSKNTLPAPFDNKQTGMISLAWNSSGIYGTAKVPDTRIREDQIDPTMGDCIELYFQKDTLYPAKLTKASLAMYIAPVRNADSCLVFMRDDTTVSKTKAISASYFVQTDTGYVVNFFIPKEQLLPFKLAENEKMGFTYCVSNRGEPMEQFFCHKDYDASFTKPKRWGTIVFVK